MKKSKTIKYTSVRQMLEDEGAPPSTLEKLEQIEARPFRHKLKSLTALFEPIFHQVAYFDVRENDRDFKIGEAIVFREFQPCKQCGGVGHYQDDTKKRHECHCNPPHGRYTGREKVVTIQYILHGGARCSVIAGWCVLGFAPNTPSS